MATTFFIKCWTWTKCRALVFQQFTLGSFGVIISMLVSLRASTVRWLGCISPSFDQDRCGNTCFSEVYFGQLGIIFGILRSLRGSAVRWLRRFFAERQPWEMRWTAFFRSLLWSFGCHFSAYRLRSALAIFDGYMFFAECWSWKMCRTLVFQKYTLVIVGVIRGLWASLQASSVRWLRRFSLSVEHERSVGH